MTVILKYKINLKALSKIQNQIKIIVTMNVQ
jgi:hypothetical protein